MGNVIRFNIVHRINFISILIVFILCAQSGKWDQFYEYYLIEDDMVFKSGQPLTRHYARNPYDVVWNIM
jgi:hypothetical protein